MCRISREEKTSGPNGAQHERLIFFPSTALMTYHCRLDDIHGFEIESRICSEPWRRGTWERPRSKLPHRRLHLLSIAASNQRRPVISLTLYIDSTSRAGRLRSRRDSDVRMRATPLHTPAEASGQRPARLIKEARPSFTTNTSLTHTTTSLRRSLESVHPDSPRAPAIPPLQSVIILVILARTASSPFSG